MSSISPLFSISTNFSRSEVWLLFPTRHSRMIASVLETTTSRRDCQVSQRQRCYNRRPVFSGASRALSASMYSCNRNQHPRCTQKSPILLPFTALTGTITSIVYAYQSPNGASIPNQITQDDFLRNWRGASSAHNERAALGRISSRYFPLDASYGSAFNTFPGVEKTSFKHSFEGVCAVASALQNMFQNI